LGFDVEVDIWEREGELWLGHDRPQYKLSLDFLYTDINDEPLLYRLWFHCKNASAIEFIRGIPHAKYFWHQNDDYTLTSNGLIWTYPGKPLLPNISVAVLPELQHDISMWNAAAICTDYPLEYRKIYESRNIN